jgi:hypothetical protein
MPFDAYSSMSWEVEYTDEFERWWEGLDAGEQESVAASVGLLEERGPALGYPHSSDIRGTPLGRLRELRVQHGGRPLRVIYAFDPRRVAILLLGGDKTGDGRFYDRVVPLAERLYGEHLEQLRREGMDDG